MDPRSFPRLSPSRSKAILVSWLALCGLFVLPSVPLLAEDASAGTETAWRYTPRDVYIDGRLDREARVFVASEPSRLALISAQLDGIWVAEPESGLLSLLALDQLQLDGDKAHSSQAPEPQGQGLVTDAGEAGLILDDKGTTVLVTAHQGPSGELSRQELWHYQPQWKNLWQVYEPDDQAVQALREIDEKVQLEVAFGTWCGDSRRDVPALIKALDVAANPRLSLRLVALGRGFEQPGPYIREQRVTNVPTVLLRQEGEEIGRYVEMPSSERVELDLASLLRGETYDLGHPWDLSQPLAKGSYRYLDAGGEEQGTERWALYARDDGGRLLHSLQRVDGREVELWLRLDEQGGARFAEITRRGDEEIVRTRLSLRGQRASATTRGSSTGIVRQALDLPPGATLLPPGAAGALLPLMSGQGVSAEEQRDLVMVGSAGEKIAGQLGRATLRSLGEAQVTVPGGEPVQARRWQLEVNGESSRWWEHPELGIPVAGELADGRRVELDELQIVIPDNGLSALASSR